MNHSQLSEIRQIYVQAYNSYLAALSGVMADELLIRDVIYPTATKRVTALSGDLRESFRVSIGHIRSHILEVIRSVYLKSKESSNIVVWAAIEDFGMRLADEAIERAMQRADQDRQVILRIVNDTMMIYGLTQLAEGKGRLIAIRKYITKQKALMEASGRHARSLNVIKACVNSAIYRAHNEAAIFLFGQGVYVARYPELVGKMPFEFTDRDYYYSDLIKSLFHPNSEALVVVK